MLDARYEGAYSQPEVLLRHMHGAVLAVPGFEGQEVVLTHGAQVRATLVTPRIDGEGTFFFCPLSKLIVAQVFNPGDGGHLSERAAVQGLRSPGIGYLVVRNALVLSNGRNVVRADDLTQVEVLPAQYSIDELVEQELVAATVFATGRRKRSHLENAARVLAMSAAR